MSSNQNVTYFFENFWLFLYLLLFPSTNLSENFYLLSHTLFIVFCVGNVCAADQNWSCCAFPTRDHCVRVSRIYIYTGRGQNNFLTAASLFHDHKTTIPRTRLYFQFAFIVIGFAITSANFLQCRRTIIFSWAATLVETVRFDETFSVFSTCYQITNAYRKQRNGKSTRKWINWKRGK